MELLVIPLEDHPIGDGPVEIVECKGPGHPDTICDALAEEFTRTRPPTHISFPVNRLAPGRPASESPD